VNAIDAATPIALGEAFRELQDDDDLSVGIITGRQPGGTSGLGRGDGGRRAGGLR
jgi:enoyl-CoA hydratase/carnithine racemase